MKKVYQRQQKRNILYGKHTIEKTKAPVGYKLNDETYKVLIADDGATVGRDITGGFLIIENIKKPTDRTCNDFYWSSIYIETN